VFFTALGLPVSRAFSTRTLAATIIPRGIYGDLVQMQNVKHNGQVKVNFSNNTVEQACLKHEMAKRRNGTMGKSQCECL